MQVLKPIVKCSLHGDQPCLLVCEHVEHAQAPVHDKTEPTENSPGRAVCQICSETNPKLRPMCGKCAEKRIALVDQGA
jgi:hypothetical protein